MDHIRRRRRGSTLVEFALTFPVYVVVLMGVVDAGWLYFQQASLDGATRAACRSGTTVDPGVGNVNIMNVYTQVENQVEAELDEMGVDSSNLSVTSTTSGAPPTRTLICTVQQPYTALTRLVLPDLTLTATTAMRMEYQR
jgi:Flp pilus assembly protein TadG